VCIALYWECESHYVDFTREKPEIIVRELKEGEEGEREPKVQLTWIVQRYKPSVPCELCCNL
jgi:hypothetical protein